MGKGFAAIMLVIGLVAGVAVVKVFDDGGGGSKDSGDIPNTITVQGTATVSSAPDQAVINLGVKSEGDTAESAFAESSKRTDAVVAALKQAGVADEDIATTDLRLDKRTENRDTPQERTFFQAENKIDVTVTNVDTAGTVAAAAVGAGANVVGGIQFTLENEASAKQKALQRAIEGAREKAGTMATAAGAQVGDVQLIDETNSESQPYRQSGDAFAAYDQAQVLAPATVSPGNVDTRVTVTVVYELET